MLPARLKRKIYKKNYTSTEKLIHFIFYEETGWRLCPEDAQTCPFFAIPKGPFCLLATEMYAIGVNSLYKKNLFLTLCSMTSLYWMSIWKQMESNNCGLQSRGFKKNDSKNRDLLK